MTTVTYLILSDISAVSEHSNVLIQQRGIAVLSVKFSTFSCLLYFDNHLKSSLPYKYVQGSVLYAILKMPICELNTLTPLLLSSQEKYYVYKQIRKISQITSCRNAMLHISFYRCPSLLYEYQPCALENRHFIFIGACKVHLPAIKHLIRNGKATALNAVICYHHINITFFKNQFQQITQMSFLSQGLSLKILKLQQHLSTFIF